MAKYFLGSVGSAEAIRMVEGKPEVAFVAKTLTDSSISVTITKDELRGGTGAPVVTNFFHDPAVAITLTDILFKESYVEAQLGTTFGQGASMYYSDGPLSTTTAGELTLNKKPVSLGMLKCDNASSTIIAWYTEEGKDEYTAVSLSESDATALKLKDAGIKTGKKYCVRYLTDEDSARQAIVKSNMVPQELMLIITVPLFAGDACAASKAGKAGTLTFEVPRFQLDGGQEFTFNMSSNATMNLSGTALVMNEGCDANSGKLFRIIEFIEGRALTEDLLGVMINPESAKVGAKVSDVEIYALYKNKSILLLKHDTQGLVIKIGEGAAAEDTELQANNVLNVTFGDKKDSYTVVAA